MSNRGSETSIFDNSEFTNGFIEFWDSTDCKKYLLPFLTERLTQLRDKLESSNEPNIEQNRIKELRFIMDRSQLALQTKRQKVSEQTDSSN